MLSKHTFLTKNAEDIFGKLPSGRYQSNEELRCSLDKIMRKRPIDGPIWVFAYGSLIWNPIINFAEKKRGFLPGWQRAFCMKLDSGRGTPEYPGRMLALNSGEGTTGLLLRLDEHDKDENLFLLWQREMCTNSYIPQWETVITDSGESIVALVFVIKASHPVYDSRYEPEEIAKRIARASGPLGSNAEYLEFLHDNLEKLGISDPYISKLHQLVVKEFKNLE